VTLEGVGDFGDVREGRRVGEEGVEVVDGVVVN
jgi:hypothetical protein